MKLSLGANKPEHDIESEPETEASPWEVEPQPLESGAPKLGIKPKEEPEPPKEEAPKEEPPAAGTKSPIKIRGFASKTPEPKEEKSSETEKPAGTDEPASAIPEIPKPPEGMPPLFVTDDEPAAEESTPKEEEKPPPPVEKTEEPPPVEKKKPVAAPPPPGLKKKKPVDAPPPPGLKKKAAPEEKDEEEETKPKLGLKMSGPRPRDLEAVDDEKEDDDEEEAPEKKKSAASTLVKAAVAFLILIVVFGGAGYFLVKMFLTSSSETEAEIDNSPIKTTVRAAEPRSETVKTPKEPEPEPVYVEEPPQMVFEEVNLGPKPTQQQAAQQTTAAQADVPKVQNPDVVAYIETLGITGVIGSGTSAKILVQGRVFPANSVVDDDLGISFLGISPSGEIIFSDSAGVQYIKDY